MLPLPTLRWPIDSYPRVLPRPLRRLLPPDTLFAAYWNQWLLWLVVYNAFVLPLDLAFDTLQPIRYILSPLEYSVDSFFLFGQPPEASVGGGGRCSPKLCREA